MSQAEMTEQGFKLLHKQEGRHQPWGILWAFCHVIFCGETLDAPEVQALTDQRERDLVKSSLVSQ